MNNNLTCSVLVAAGVLAGLVSYSVPAEARDPAPAAQTAEREILYWVAPMDPSYKRDKPGKSPMGMDLVPVYAGEAKDKPAKQVGMKHSDEGMKPPAEGMNARGGCGAVDQSGHAAHAVKREPLYWVAPMDPDYKRDKPGKSPMGMDLVPVYAKDAAGSEGDKAGNDSLPGAHTNGCSGAVHKSGHSGGQHE